MLYLSNTVTEILLLHSTLMALDPHWSQSRKTSAVRSVHSLLIGHSPSSAHSFSHRQAWSITLFQYSRDCQSVQKKNKNKIRVPDSKLSCLLMSVGLFPRVSQYSTFTMTITVSDPLIWENISTCYCFSRYVVCVWFFVLFLGLLLHFSSPSIKKPIYCYMKGMFSWRNTRNWLVEFATAPLC